ncbi:hypothetical protein [Neorhizobium galegae]|uniref:hypothetical protein n=1 Tax=Neorhizobium galegae TaxID=399 RepID=UPI0012FEAA38|nr:hypothetical protein [Neorhizobium galegae]
MKKIAEFSFRKLQQAASLAFKGIAAGAVLASLKIKAIALAALESSKGMSEMLDKVSKDSRRLGISAKDVGLLRYGFDQQGVDADEVLQALSDIGNEFENVRQQIDQADEAYNKTKAWNVQKVLASRSGQSIMDALASNDEAAPNSLAGIADQQALIRKRIEMSVKGEDELRLRLVERYHALEDDRKKFIQGLGQQGQALFRLQDFGLDYKQGVKGGIEGLTALSNAFRQIPDAQERLHISMQLFGEDAGAKMVTVLETGGEAIEKYQARMDSLGATITEADAKRGAEARSVYKEMMLAFQGARLELDRQITPLIMESQKQLTEWIATNRVWIAETFKAAFVETRNLFYDLIDLFHGKQSDFRNSWLNATAPTLIFISTWIGKIRTEVGKIFSGENSDWAWLNLARDGLVGLYKLVKDVWVVAFGGKAVTFPWVDTIVAQIKWIYAAILDIPNQLSLLWNGKDSDWDWLNTIRDGLLYVRDLAVDVWNVLTGGDAKRFDFLNGWRDQVVAFADQVKRAFTIVKDALELLHSGMQWLLGFVGGDATTVALVGIFAKIAASILGIATAAKVAKTAIGLLMTAGRWLLGIGGGAAAAGAAAGGAATAAAGALSAAGTAAVGGGLVASLTRVGVMVTGLIRSFGLLGATITGVMIAGKYALDYSAQSGDAVIQKQLELMRFQADRQVQAREDWMIMHPAPKAPEVTMFQGQQILTRDQLSALAEEQGTSNEAYAGRRAGIINDYARNNQQVTERIAIDLNLGNKTVSGTVDRTNADILKDINRNLRTY